MARMAVPRFPLRVEGAGERCYQPTIQPMVAIHRPAHARTPMILSAVSRGLRLRRRPGCGGYTTPLPVGP
jgi:hypothetical protein